MTTLEIISVNIWNILFALANLLILFLVIKKFLFGKVEKVIEDRKNSIEDDYTAARVARENAGELEKSYKEKLDSADREAEKIIKRSEERADRSYDKIVGDAKDRASRIIEAAELQAAYEKEKAALEIKEEIAEVSVEIAKRLLEKELTEKDHNRLFEDALSEMATSDGVSGTEDGGGTDK